eukprot:COSAG01_NODE_1099_length_11701_cov_8.251508_7_plen_132_part_00
MLLGATCMLRRTKSDVLSELPPKTRKVVELHNDDVDAEEDADTVGCSAGVISSKSISAPDTDAKAALTTNPTITDLALDEDETSEYRRCGLAKVQRADFQAMLERIAKVRVSTLHLSVQRCSRCVPFECRV